ncbi:MAG: small subunit ribosomal protein S1, partial [Myxococcota bacterium]
FGVFVAIEEGIDGLVHISDLAWDQSIKDPREHYTVGDELETSLLSIDVENERASLGLKQLTTDPWDAIEDRYPIGRVVEGTVVKLLEFGAIVRLEPTIEALVHISEFSEERVEDLNEVVQMDQVLRAKVINVSADQRKIGLSVKRVHEADAAAAMEEAEAPTRTTIGDLIAEKIDISQLPEGKDD